MNLRRLLLAISVGTWMLGPVAAQEVMPGAEPIPMPATAFLEKDYCLQERQWAERCLLEPAKKKWQGQPWSDEAAKLVQETFQLQELENAPIADLASLAPRFRTLLERVPDEPLICLLAAQAFYDERRNWRDSQPALDRLLAVNSMPTAVESQALQILMPRLWERGQDRMGVYHRLLRATLRSISDGSYDPEAEAVFVRHQIAAIETSGVQYMPWFTDYKAAIRKSQWSEWAKLTLEGYAETEMAWVGRTSKWADEVKDDQWQQFSDHLKIARELLTKAHALRPERPEAAAQMIPVAMGDSDIKETRLWFDRAVSAQFDYLPAYGRLLLAYRPRWGGDYDLMLAFGKACVATKRYDTAIPLRFMCACIDVGTEGGVPSAVCKDPPARASLLEIAHGYLNAKDVPPQTRHMRVSNAALCAWL
ncbi:MAG: hypothetical protein U0984_15145, partial [Prosthecobacter sp.]|nr:hypothetical protein [Prosthecobacter sp.]